MSLVVCRIRPSINAAYQKSAAPINVSLPALYGKIAHRAGRRGRAGALTAERLFRSSPP